MAVSLNCQQNRHTRHARLGSAPDHPRLQGFRYFVARHRLPPCARPWAECTAWYAISPRDDLSIFCSFKDEKPGTPGEAVLSPRSKDPQTVSVRAKVQLCICWPDSEMTGTYQNSLICCLEAREKKHTHTLTYTCAQTL